MFLSKRLQANHDYFLDEDGILEGDRLVLYSMSSSHLSVVYVCSTLFILCLAALATEYRFGCNNLNGNEQYRNVNQKHPVPYIWNPEGT